ERERGDCSRALETEQEALREAIVVWKQQLIELPFDQERVREAFTAVTSFGLEVRSVEPLRQPLLRALGEKRDLLGSERLQLQHQMKELEQRREQLAEEKRSWEQEREPEPLRSVARMQRRADAAIGTGAPLY